MIFKITDIIKDAGNGEWNEDDIIITPDCIAVIDGATSIKKIEFEGHETYAKWLVQEFKKNFLAEYKSECHIPSYVKQCIDTIIRKYPLPDISFYQKPTFTFSAIQIVGSSLKCFTIGDCSIYIKEKNNSKIVTVYDKRVDKFSHRTLLQLQYAKRNNLDIESHIRETRITNLNYRNKPDGFWVVGYDGNFEDEFIEKEFDIRHADSFLICSDGFNRAFREFALYTPMDFFTHKINFKQALDAIRKYEEANHEAPDFPCVKRSDDVSAVLFTTVS